MSEQLGVHSFRRLRGGFTYNHKAITFAQDDGACRIGDNLVEDDISLRQAGGEGCPRGQVSFSMRDCISLRLLFSSQELNKQ